MAYAASIVSGSKKKCNSWRSYCRKKKVIKLLKSKDVVFSFPKIDNLKILSLISFSDASFANLKCSGLQGGLKIFLE